MQQYENHYFNELSKLVSPLLKFNFYLPSKDLIAYFVVGELIT